MMGYDERFVERSRESVKRLYYRKKITDITHLKADDKTLCNRHILWNTNLSQDEDPTCLTCLRTLKRVENERT